MDRTLWLLPFACCVSIMLLYLPLALQSRWLYDWEVNYVRLQHCSRCRWSAFLLSGSVTITARIFQIVSPLFGVHLFCTMGCFRRYISFRLPKAISSAFGSAPYESSFLIGWWCWWTVCHCLCLVFVMVGLFVIAFPTSAPLALGLCAADYCPWELTA